MLCWWGQGWRRWLLSMLDKAWRDWPHVGRCRNTSRVWAEDTVNTRSHRLPGAQIWVGSSWSCSVSGEDSGCTPWCSTDVSSPCNLRVGGQLVGSFSLLTMAFILSAFEGVTLNDRQDVSVRVDTIPALSYGHVCDLMFLWACGDDWRCYLRCVGRSSVARSSSSTHWCSPPVPAWGSYGRASVAPEIILPPACTSVAVSCICLLRFCISISGTALIDRSAVMVYGVLASCAGCERLSWHCSLYCVWLTGLRSWFMECWHPALAVNGYLDTVHCTVFDWQVCGHGLWSVGILRWLWTVISTLFTVLCLIDRSVVMVYGVLASCAGCERLSRHCSLYCVWLTGLRSWFMECWHPALAVNGYLDTVHCTVFDWQVCGHGLWSVGILRWLWTVISTLFTVLCLIDRSAVMVYGVLASCAGCERLLSTLFTVLCLIDRSAVMVYGVLASCTGCERLSRHCSLYCVWLTGLRSWFMECWHPALAVNGYLDTVHCSVFDWQVCGHGLWSVGILRWLWTVISTLFTVLCLIDRSAVMVYGVLASCAGCERLLSTLFTVLCLIDRSAVMVYGVLASCAGCERLSWHCSLYCVWLTGLRSWFMECWHPALAVNGYLDTVHCSVFDWQVCGHGLWSVGILRWLWTVALDTVHCTVIDWQVCGHGLWSVGILRWLWTVISTLFTVLCLIDRSAVMVYGVLASCAGCERLSRHCSVFDWQVCGHGLWSVGILRWLWTVALDTVHCSVFDWQVCGHGLWSVGILRWLWTVISTLFCVWLTGLRSWFMECWHPALAVNGYLDTVHCSVFDWQVCGHGLWSVGILRWLWTVALDTVHCSVFDWQVCGHGLWSVGILRWLWTVISTLFTVLCLIDRSAVMVYGVLASCAGCERLSRHCSLYCVWLTGLRSWFMECWHPALAVNGYLDTVHCSVFDWQVCGHGLWSVGILRWLWTVALDTVHCTVFDWQVCGDGLWSVGILRWLWTVISTLFTVLCLIDRSAVMVYGVLASCAGCERLSRHCSLFCVWLTGLRSWFMECWHPALAVNGYLDTVHCSVFDWQVCGHGLWSVGILRWLWTVALDTVHCTVFDWQVCGHGLWSVGILRWLWTVILTLFTVLCLIDRSAVMVYGVLASCAGCERLSRHCSLFCVWLTGLRSWFMECWHPALAVNGCSWHCSLYCDWLTGLRSWFMERWHPALAVNGYLDTDTVHCSVFDWQVCGHGLWSVGILRWLWTVISTLFCVWLTGLRSWFMECWHPALAVNGCSRHCSLFCVWLTGLRSWFMECWHPALAVNGYLDTVLCLIDRSAVMVYGVLASCAGCERLSRHCSLFCVWLTGLRSWFMECWHPALAVNGCSRHCSLFCVWLTGLWSWFMECWHPALAVNGYLDTVHCSVFDWQVCGHGLWSVGILRWLWTVALDTVHCTVFDWQVCGHGLWSVCILRWMWTVALDTVLCLIDRSAVMVYGALASCAGCERLLSTLFCVWLTGLRSWFMECWHPALAVNGYLDTVHCSVFDWQVCGHGLWSVGILRWLWTVALDTVHCTVIDWQVCGHGLWSVGILRWLWMVALDTVLCLIDRSAVMVYGALASCAGCERLLSTLFCVWLTGLRSWFMECWHPALAVNGYLDTVLCLIDRSAVMVYGVLASCAGCERLSRHCSLYCVWLTGLRSWFMEHWHSALAVNGYLDTVHCSVIDWQVCGHGLWSVGILRWLWTVISTLFTVLWLIDRSAVMVYGALASCAGCERLLSTLFCVWLTGLRSWFMECWHPALAVNGYLDTVLCLIDRSAVMVYGVLASCAGCERLSRHCSLFCVWLTGLRSWFMECWHPALAVNGCSRHCSLFCVWLTGLRSWFMECWHPALAVNGYLDTVHCSVFDWQVCGHGLWSVGILRWLWTVISTLFTVLCLIDRSAVMVYGVLASCAGCERLSRHCSLFCVWLTGLRSWFMERWHPALAVNGCSRHCSVFDWQVCGHGLWSVGILRWLWTVALDTVHCTVFDWQVCGHGLWSVGILRWLWTVALDTVLCLIDRSAVMVYGALASCAGCERLLSTLFTVLCLIDRSAVMVYGALASCAGCERLLSTLFCVWLTGLRS